jgi:hypothetical protein
VVGKAQLGLKALAQAWLWRAQSSQNVRPGLEARLGLSWGPAQLKPQPVSGLSRAAQI